jgi:hypothetical protein
VELRDFLSAALEPKPRLRASAEMLLRHAFLRPVRGRVNDAEWLERNATPLSRLCGSLRQRMHHVLEDQLDTDSLDDMYGSDCDDDGGSDTQSGGAARSTATLTSTSSTTDFATLGTLVTNTANGTLLLHDYDCSPRQPGTHSDTTGSDNAQQQLLL